MYIAKAIFVNSVLTVLCAVAAIITAFFESIGASIVFAATASVYVFLLGVRVSKSIFSLTSVFLFFSGLYGMLGPISAHFGEGLAPIFPQPYVVQSYLLCYSIALLGLTLGLSFASVFFAPVNCVRNDQWCNRPIVFIAQLMLIGANVMEAVNFFRIGGFGTLYQGKAIFQSALESLTVTLPAAPFYFLGMGLLGIIAGRVVRKVLLLQDGLKILMWTILIVAPLARFVVIGQRMEIMITLLSFAIGYLYSKKFVKIKPKTFALVASAYILLSGLSGVRAILPEAIVTSDYSTVSQHLTDGQYWLENLNLSSNEFAAPFGNFNTYVLLSHEAPLFGSSYVQGLAMPIPRFIWPDKPRSASHEFRDKFFSEERDRGTIAGTAFSSILEAYMNFRAVGVFVIYFAIAGFLSLLESKKWKSNSIVFFALYVSFVPFVMTFHRSALESPYFWPFFMALLTKFVVASRSKRMRASSHLQESAQMKRSHSK